MSSLDFTTWSQEVVSSSVVVYAKRLSANDTAETGGHQAGVYLPKPIAFRALPELERPSEGNPDQNLDLYIASHGDRRRIRAIWYRTGTRDECRLTQFGGSKSPMLDPANTGALVLLAFLRTSDGPSCSIWLCRSVAEEDEAESCFGVVEPGRTVVWSPFRKGETPLELQSSPSNCDLQPHEIPKGWKTTFPSGAEIFRKSLELLPVKGLPPDNRLARRVDCEYAVFESLERFFVEPMIRDGFPTVKAFRDCAHSVLQRRKSRAGRSLELHVKEIFQEEGFVEGRDFQHNVESEPNRRPDFLFPSQSAYREASFPAEKLTMLGVKTTCKDRWRQVLNEAARIPTKHLLTTQRGISTDQYDEMTASGIRLVVPAPLHDCYDVSIRKHLLSISDFLNHVRSE